MWERCSDFLPVVGVTGFEPATPWSQTTYATICATPRRIYTFYYKRDRNINSKIGFFHFCSNIFFKYIY